MRETTRALRAFEDYWEMGAGRSLEKLAARYRSATGPVPSPHISRLKIWSTRHGWQERIRLREQRLAAESDSRIIEEQAEWKRQRIREAQAAHAAGREILTAILRRIQLGDLSDVQLVGRLVYPEKGRPYRLDGLLDSLQAAVKALEIGHKEVRLELGEPTERTEVQGNPERPLVALNDILSILPADIRDEVSGRLMARLRAEGSAGDVDGAD